MSHDRKRNAPEATTSRLESLLLVPYLNAEVFDFLVPTDRHEIQRLCRSLTSIIAPRLTWFHPQYSAGPQLIPTANREADPYILRSLLSHVQQLAKPDGGKWTQLTSVHPNLRALSVYPNERLRRPSPCTDKDESKQFTWSVDLRSADRSHAPKVAELFQIFGAPPTLASELCPDGYPSYRWQISHVDALPLIQWATVHASHLLLGGSDEIKALYPWGSMILPHTGEYKHKQPYAEVSELLRPLAGRRRALFQRGMKRYLEALKRGNRSAFYESGYDWCHVRMRGSEPERKLVISSTERGFSVQFNPQRKTTEFDGFSTIAPIGLTDVAQRTFLETLAAELIGWFYPKRRTWSSADLEFEMCNHA
jgi:hypothetical protein